MEIVDEAMRVLKGQKDKSKRSKRWFINKYLPEEEYSAINNQILGYTKKPSKSLISACLKFLKEVDCMTKQEVLKYIGTQTDNDVLSEIKDECERIIKSNEVKKTRLDRIEVDDKIVLSYPDGHAFGALTGEVGVVKLATRDTIKVSIRDNIIEVPRRYIKEKVGE